jgi:AcrR family transcriptional regulator
VKRGTETVERPAGGKTQRAAHEFPPTAEKILKATRRVLLKRGYAGLTMQAVEQESGLNRSLVHYYFGSKAGLLDAIVGTLFEDPAFGYSDEVMRAPPGETRAETLIDWLERISADRRSARLLYEMLPHVLRSKKLCARVAALYAAYRAFDGQCLSGETGAMGTEEREVLGALSVAMVEGLAIQAAVDPDGFDRERAFSLWRDVLLHYLRSDKTRERKAERA